MAPPELIVDNAKLVEPEKRGDALQRYGSLQEGLHITSYSFERACSNLEWFLSEDRWRLGGRHKNINQFLDSLHFDEVRPSIEQRQRIVQRIKELQPAASNRQIARTLGVDHQTVNNDIGEKSPPALNNINDLSAKSGEKSPPAQSADKRYVTLADWNELHPDLQLPGGIIDEMAGSDGLNPQDNKDIEWADWSWNPVSGCLHDCPYCYARDIAVNIYPAEVGFQPTLWPIRINAPINRYPKTADTAAKNIFVCSMADLFGRWVPVQWIERVLQTVADSPQWNFLFLTKFPKRMSEFKIPSNAWMGTTVDLQARVANAEKAFERVQAPIRWLSIEPMLEPLEFTHLDLFDWIVIGGASPSRATDGSPATPEWNVPIDWIVDLHGQARRAGCKIFYKTNSGLMGVTRLREYPGSDLPEIATPSVFDYLRAIPKKDQIG
jgi:protein gp37